MDRSSDSLIHYGVKGMKWGVHRAELSAPNSRYSSEQRSKDLKDHGKRGVKRINKRLNKGQTLKKARGRETLRNTLQAAALIGAYQTARILEVAGPAFAQSIAVRAETKRGQASAAASMGLPGKASSGPSYAKQKRGAYNISSL